MKITLHNLLLLIIIQKETVPCYQEIAYDPNKMVHLEETHSDSEVVQQIQSLKWAHKTSYISYKKYAVS